MRAKKRARLRKQRLNDEGSNPRNVDTEITYCYCNAWDLTWPHYQAEHDADHDLAKLARVRHADGLR